MYLKNDHSNWKQRDYITNKLLNEYDHICIDINLKQSQSGQTKHIGHENSANNKIDINILNEIFSNKSNSIKSISLNNKIDESTDINEEYSIYFEKVIN